MKGNNWLWFFLFLGGLLGGTSVLLSAWGAHGLEDLFVASPRDRFSFNYATHFQLFHALFLILAGAFYGFEWNSSGFTCGICNIFSSWNFSFFIPNLFSNYRRIFRIFRLNPNRWNLFFSRLELDFGAFRFQNHIYSQNRAKLEL